MSIANKGLEVGQPAPYWELLGIDGRKVSLDQFRGRPLLMFFFRGTWCPNCRRQMEDIRNQWERIAPLAQVVGVVGQGDRETADYMARNQLPFPLLPDPSRSIIKSYGVYQFFSLNAFRIAHPTTLIIDSAGLVHFCYVGESQFDRPDLDHIVSELQNLRRLTA